MESAFYDCKKLEKGPTILSNNVTNITYTFFGCTSLINLPEIIPHSVINMLQTFNGCSSASGNIEINANLNGKVIYKFEWKSDIYTQWQRIERLLS